MYQPILLPTDGSETHKVLTHGVVPTSVCS